MYSIRKLYILIIILMLVLITDPVSAAPQVTLDGQKLQFSVAPVIDNGTTLVPLRTIFEAMGASVSWDQNSQTAKAVKGNIKVVLKVGSLSPTINGQVKKLDVPAKIINGSTMAPLRFVGEAFGGSVGWDQGSQTITILSKPTSGTPPPTSSKTNDQVKVHFIDVGQADAVYIQLPNNNDILIDAGNVADGSTVVSYLKAQKVDDIELLIATHPHEDHIGGLPDVLSAFKVEEILDSGDTADSKIYNTYAADAKIEGCPWVQDDYQTFKWGNCKLEILTGKTSWDDANDCSVVSRLDIGTVHVLFDGDAETPAESALQGDISAQILKVGHHGSTSSTSDGFISKVKPQVAIISVGAGNTYGHPAATTLAKLQKAGAKIYRTDLNGNVVVTTDGSTYSINAQKTSIAPTTTQQTITQPAQNVNNNTVYITKSGAKYHRSGCRYLKSSCIPITLSEAQSEGYTPCSVCNP